MFTIEEAIKPRREVDYNSSLSLPSTLDGGWCSTPDAVCFTPTKEIRYLFYRRL